ncbi:hypothetical protein BMF94_0864 [Rhodotorula taiwanensis]|uniref:C-CAP/cofactor C-like domain-containing protein n=1 Tax=Rhodotorula taiwanensis TaxID=741276 RepID=A0A2S5BH99_9BASI|nr:hypothetical protein BMF94_0864 [Rhodotorula taiwanensis]
MAQLRSPSSSLPESCCSHLAFARPPARSSSAALPGTGGDTTQRLKELSSELTDRASDLPAFELRRCQRELESAQKRVTDATTATAGAKPRFSFKKRTAPAATEVTARNPEVVAPSPPPASSTSYASSTVSAGGPPLAASLPPNALTLSDRSDAYLSRADLPSQPSAASPAASTSQALVISSIACSVVNLLPASRVEEPDLSYSAVYLTGLKDSLVLLPENGRKGSALVQDCQHCVIVLAGHQVSSLLVDPNRRQPCKSADKQRLALQIRIHDSSDCTFLLAAGSSPIIERCRRLKFAPFPTSFLEASAFPTRLDETRDRPTRLDVQDFDDPFASASRPSANWQLASEEEVESLSQAIVLLAQSPDGRPSADSWKKSLKAALTSALNDAET